jgi:hypothetical protein
MIIQARTHVITPTYLNSHLLGAPREYVPHGLDPGLDWASCWSSFPCVFLVCPGPSSILLFALTDRVAHLTPSLLPRRLLTNVQVNNITTLHDTHGHTYIHHIGITILLLFYTSSTLLGRPAGPDPSVWHISDAETTVCVKGPNSQYLSVCFYYVDVHENYCSF